MLPRRTTLSFLLALDLMACHQDNPPFPYGSHDPHGNGDPHVYNDPLHPSWFVGGFNTTGYGEAAGAWQLEFRPEGQGYLRNFEGSCLRREFRFSWSVRSYFSDPDRDLHLTLHEKREAGCPHGGITYSHWTGVHPGDNPSRRYHVRNLDNAYFEICADGWEECMHKGRYWVGYRRVW